MWNRKELKAKAKVAFKRNYWYCVLAALLLAVVLGSVAGSTSGRAPADSETPTRVYVTAAFMSTAFVTLARIFALNPFTVGCRKFFAENTLKAVPLDSVVVGFTRNYIRNVAALFLRDLFTFLWSLLLVVPGIMKAYSYRMVPYILADDPGMDAKEALDVSSRMMYGHRWNAFVMDLSFIGWYLLCAVTFGILAIFYVNPYVDAAHAELYLALRNNQRIIE